MFKVHNSCHVLFNIVQPNSDPMVLIAIFLLQITGITGLISSITLRNSQCICFSHALLFSAWFPFEMFFVPVAHFHEQNKGWIDKMTEFGVLC